MERENKMEIDRYDETNIKISKIGKLSASDLLFMLGGVAIIGIVTMLLSWIIM